MEAALNTRQRKTSKTVKVDGGVIDPDHLTQADFEVEVLGDCKIPSPLAKPGWINNKMLDDTDVRIMYDPQVRGHCDASSGGGAISPSPFSMRVANARQTLFFEPKNVVAGIITCGGLCPGLNDVVRALVHACYGNYEVQAVYGFRYGYWGLSAAGRDSALLLSRTSVHQIHHHGGTFLGTSRGPQSIEEMVDTLVQYKVNILFTIGGDGTQRGAESIGNEVRRRGLAISIMGIPKTIDNDLSFSHRTFGYLTAVEAATKAIRCVHAEAQSHDHGVGIVKVMGRHSGFIAAQATISCANVDICLVPEDPMPLETVLKLVDARLQIASNCVICVAEGFGQNWSQHGSEQDASGNAKLIDIGAVLSQAVSKWMKKHPKYKDGTVKYIDPSYMVRSCPATANDSAFCVSLANLAVHEAMAGVTNAVVSFWYSNFIMVPIRLATSLRKVLDINGKTWRQVREMCVDLHRVAHMKERRARGLERRIAGLEEEKRQLQIMLAKL